MRIPRLENEDSKKLQNIGNTNSNVQGARIPKQDQIY